MNDAGVLPRLSDVVSAKPRSISRLLLATALVGVLGIAHQPRLCFADTLAEITDAWKNRTEKIHSAEFRLHRIVNIQSSLRDEICLGP